LPRCSIRRVEASARWPIVATTGRTKTKIRQLQPAGGAAVEAWIKGGRPEATVLEAVEVKPPKLNKGESVIDAIDRHRRRPS
jgi:hypothetical protein